MSDRYDSTDYQLHTLAIILARKAAGLPVPTQGPDDPWWDEGPHIEKDGRKFYVHAMGALQDRLGRAMEEHPDWFTVSVVMQGESAQVLGLDGDLVLGDLVNAELTPDEARDAIELTNREKRRRWGVKPPKRSR